MHKSYNPIRCIMALIAMVACLGGAAQEREMLRVTKTDGSVVTHELSKISKITVGPEDLTPAAHVGDFYYSDGTWSTAIDDSKTVVGVVFAVGDPTKEDPVLRAEHPECTHGWVVSAFSDKVPMAWQSEVDKWGKEVQSWLDENRPEDLHVASHYGLDTYRNMAIGYSNTLSTKYFNVYNYACAVDPVRDINAYTSAYPAPESSSGWYVPSVKEAFMLIAGTPDNEEILDATRTTANRVIVDRSLGKILGGSTLYSTSWAYDIWTSMEFDDNGYAVEVSSATIEGIKKASSSNCVARYILAF